MIIIYSVDEAGIDAPGYFLSRDKAFESARHVSAYFATDAGGMPIEVTKNTVPKLDIDTLVSALNGRGWCDSSEVIATFVAGRPAKTPGERHD